MSKFYGTVVGSAKTNATRQGHSNIKVAAQSWEGSVIIELHYNGDKLMVDVSTDDGSSAYGRTLWSGTFDEFKAKFRK